MVGRITATAVVAFWAVMMAALVRMEYLGGLGGTEVPPELVLRKIFSQENPARLNVIHEGQVVGFCKIDIERLPAVSVGPANTDGAGLLLPTRYQVHTELTLGLANFGIPTRLRVVGHTQFNRDFNIDSFKITSTIGDGHFDVEGDSVNQKLELDFSIGEYRDHRVFDYQQLRGTGLQSLLGAASLANMGMLNAVNMAAALPQPDGAADAKSSRKLTTVHTSRLQIAGEMEETYLIETRLDQSMWARIWVSKQGEVLKVDTSFHLMMLADTLTEIQSRYPDEPELDTN